MKYRLTALLACLIVAAGCGGGEDGRDRASSSRPVASGGDLDSADVVLAWVGDLTVTGEDVRNHMLRSTPAQNIEAYLNNPDILQVALGGLVDQLVWGQLAKEEGYELTERERMQVKAVEAELLAARYVADVVDKKTFPSREEVQDHYNQNQEKYLADTRVAARHILVKEEGEALRIQKLAEEGADFADLVRKHSLDRNTVDIGGALGYISAGAEVLGIGKNERFTKAVLALDPGDFLVARTNKGYHLVKAERKEGGGLRPLDNVYEEISEQLRRARYSGVYNEELTLAREKASARYNTKGFERLSGVSNNCERLLSMAEGHPDAGGRIELYRRLSFDFPDCESAGKAQFMIGYLLLTAQKKPSLARKAFIRLARTFPDSPWRKAGDYMLERVAKRGIEWGTPEEVLNEVNRSGE